MIYKAHECRSHCRVAIVSYISRQFIDSLFHRFDAIDTSYLQCMYIETNQSKSVCNAVMHKGKVHCQSLLGQNMYERLGVVVRVLMHGVCSYVNFWVNLYILWILLINSVLSVYSQNGHSFDSNCVVMVMSMVQLPLCPLATANPPPV